MEIPRIPQVNNLICKTN